MSLLIKNKDRLDDPSINWLEDHLQAHCVKAFKRHPNYGKLFTLVGDQNAGKRSLRDGAMRKACGMTAGEPDLRFYFMGGRTVFFEMKRKGKKPTSVQEERIALLKSFGFFVYVVAADCPADALKQMELIFQSLGGLGEGEYTDQEVQDAAIEVDKRHGSPVGDPRQIDIEEYDYDLDD